MKTLPTLVLALFVVAVVYESGEVPQTANAAPPAQDIATSPQGETCVINLEKRRKTFDESLPTIGVILFDDVLMTEVTAPIDVFSKPRENGTALFNVVTVAETLQPVSTESGLRMLPDYTFSDCPKLTVLVVPSAYDMTATVDNDEIVRFIKKQNAHSDFTMSNCAGSQLIGESGIADGRKIVTYIGGGGDLQENYPALQVQDDQTVSFVEDGKFLSSNGNLASYISSLELLEKMSSKEHRDFVESYLYLERLTKWDQSASGK
ncbi:DJ-1/PfpI family protein [Neorhodopirellula lusitana]|uniref:DJ-1/PfpI family protein n=1 Tax=Neorhodopirellula lusitana TaxID=445327 RepID=A0ABY1Q1Q6_9BACT|nr:DJ-1/PfpI family protein [Neorhodopirellula lusitana]SMP55580.1 DJ-1/PfpI family protein [Neorhodopirellula lusitana]